MTSDAESRFSGTYGLSVFESTASRVTDKILPVDEEYGLDYFDDNWGSKYSKKSSPSLARKQGESEYVFKNASRNTNPDLPDKAAVR